METLLAVRPMYIVRFVGGSMYLVGFIMMAWNLWKTARASQPVNGEATVVVEVPGPSSFLTHLSFRRGAHLHFDEAR